MTLTELISFVRLQLQEENAAFYTDADITNYINMACMRFVTRVHPIIKRETITIDTDQVSDTAVAETFEISCVADLDSGTGSIGGQYFSIYDTSDNEYQVWYDVDDGDSFSSDYTTIEVDISADDTATAVATATASAINGESAFSASASGSTVTGVLNSTGYISSTHQNGNVNNGTDSLSISVTTSGKDDKYTLTYQPLKEKDCIIVLPSGKKYYMNRMSYGDYKRLSDTTLEDSYAYYLQPLSKYMYFPSGLNGSTVYFEYYVKPVSTEVSTFLSDNSIPEEFHELIAKYALSIAFKRDQKFNESRQYLSEYLAEEREAIELIGMQIPKSYNTDFDLSIANPHREEASFIDKYKEP